MIRIYPALCIVFIFLFCAVTMSVTAQPTLPEITGREDSGVVTLAWTCQYNSIKYISILRSYDSANYKTIGKLDHPQKGVQVYEDDNPVAGRNFYKVDVMFNSGLDWKSNYCVVFVKGADAPSSGIVLSSNTIQQVAPDMVTYTKNVVPAQKVNNISVAKQPANRMDSGTGSPSASKNINIIAAHTAIIPQSLKKDTTNVVSKSYMEDPATFAVPKQIFIIKPVYDYDTDSSSIVANIMSRFIFTDPVTGHVDLDLPGDMGRYHYSVKFYDDSGKMIIDIPKITIANIIMDKRNFQHTGNYKFVIRRNVVEFETGYVKVVPNP